MGMSWHGSRDPLSKFGTVSRLWSGCSYDIENLIIACIPAVQLVTKYFKGDRRVGGHVKPLQVMGLTLSIQ